ncbi:Protein of unknown function (DUF4058) [Armatimonadetes bacterium GXS]|nr:Protein of unknown function (DUF4058) [Armatimonadetes bacterium GXS]
MGNPFPGMNPYLEDPSIWGDVHHTLISAIRRQLNRALPKGYVALIEERIYLETVETFRRYVPDVTVSKPQIQSGEKGHPAAAIANLPVRIEIQDEPVREPFIQVFCVRNRERRLVAVIEVLSPSNKTPHSEGRKLYLQKQHELLYSNVHLMEIDLLHYGKHTVFVPYEALKRVRSEWDYLIVLHRTEWSSTKADVWFVNLAESLPRVQLPLIEDDPEVVIDLQAAIDEVYEEGQYHELLDYSVDPPVKLPEAQLAWIHALLREKGLRD